ncbi:hypothetical protein AMECASPLE_036523 [Ameca splendens]|uniref:Uncharacterized protein n=1 Tax=Ameca splendens TaxID=208324 RepID=A0ABV0XWN8_9TELE
MGSCVKKQPPIEGEFRQKADYTIINQTKQKIGEPITEYRMRMEEVFKRNSGLQHNNADDSPYQQQLKNALQANALPKIRNWVTKHNIDLPTCSVSSWQDLLIPSMLKMTYFMQDQ